MTVDLPVEYTSELGRMMYAELDTLVTLVVKYKQV